ncbi:MAG TPA: S-methyl-5'-thioadenosine phosphorylase [Anaerolineae bacterium]|nr:S-methyl-5'-thioadenosine phosphorylase [Anaerolineae bacterium]
MSEIEIGVIGGSGLYNMSGLSDIEMRAMETPFGKPSDEILIGTLGGRRVAFLPRHGRGHLLTPTEVPYQANVYAMKVLGVKYLVGVSACGSLREDYAPGHIVVPDQLFDHTKKREMSFFGEGVVAHVGVAEPFSPALSKAVAEAVGKAGGTVHEGGTFITIEGPRFSTKGESNVYRQWGMSIIGMTTSPEAYLAREAEIAFACMAHVTDYDVWHESEEPVTVEQVIAVLQKNTKMAEMALEYLVADMDSWAGEFPAHRALQDALLTDPEQVNQATVEKLGPLVAKYWGA